MRWSDKHVHVVSFDVPHPPDYGGVIDVFYKLKALSAAGVGIHLHCFRYGRPAAPALESLCASVNYYPRNVSKAQLFHRLPYIVVSRAHTHLVDHLARNDHPVLFEGLHSCYFLDEPRLAGRVRIVRTHNIEHEYYQHLAQAEPNIFKRYYYHNEAGKLAEFEPILAAADHIAAISENDRAWFEGRYGHAFYLPAFHSNERVQCPTGKGNFAFYHGNLSVGENNRAALFLVTRVFNRLSYPLVIAGHRPSRELRDVAAKHKHITLVADPTHARVRQLLADAHVNVLPALQPTGIKLKLLSALFNGRHCLVNSMMVDNTGLGPLCGVAESEDDFAEAVQALAERPFGERDVKLREEILNTLFSNDANIKGVLERLFP